MRICVLISADEPDSKLLDYETYLAPYLPEHAVDHALLKKETAVREVQELARSGGYDVFINLCDGAADEERAGVEVVLELERLGVAFTGAGSAFYEPTRAAMKEACARAAIPTPRFAFAADRAAAERAAEALRFPVIVKHPNGYASTGLTRASRVEDPADLPAQVEATARAFGGALVEEFIEGRELTVLVAEPDEGEAEPRVYPPIEVLFPPGETFKHFDLKWVEYRGLGSALLADPALAARAKSVAARFFTALGGSGYGRCDLRVDAGGALFMLEINPNCGVFYAPGEFGCADIILSLDPGGHGEFLERMLRGAERRRRRAGPRDPGGEERAR